MSTPDITSPSAASGRGRLDSVDQVRGAAMVLMALDHVRWFFTDIAAYQPETLASTNAWLFLTRWVTHFCAPAFFLLAGMAIYLYGVRIADDRSLRRYLVSRGIQLILLELTVVGFAWVFSPGYSFGGVIWSLGGSFLAMALLVKVRRLYLLVAAAGFLAFHNALLDGLATPVNQWLAFSWRALYQPGVTPIPGTDTSYMFLFPVIPWLAMMVLGFTFGPFFEQPAVKRKRIFLRIGLAMTIAFGLLRLAGNFGNPDTLWISPTTSGAYAVQPDFASTVISFLNTEKYPPSLQFTLMTLGPILLWLGLTRVDSGKRQPRWASRPLITFGRVPLFFYLCHLYLIHLLALVSTTLTGQPNGWIAFGADPSASRPDGYGFGLPGVYLAWAAVTLALYGLCSFYEKYKSRHRYAWLRYL